MQTNTILLAKKATKEALSGNWEAAIETNLSILEKDPNNIEAKLRLGHAYIQTKHPTKARKEFKEVLELDPINAVANRNLQIISKNIELTTPSRADTGTLIKEPGTTVEARFELSGKANLADTFVPGELLKIDIKKRSVDFLRLKKDKEIYIGTIEEEDIVKGLNKALEMHAHIVVSFLKGTENEAISLIKTSIPVFKSEKQDIRPYIKKGTLDDEDADEDELEIVDLS